MLKPQLLLVALASGAVTRKSDRTCVSPKHGLGGPLRSSASANLVSWNLWWFVAAPSKSTALASIFRDSGWLSFPKP